MTLGDIAVSHVHLAQVDSASEVETGEKKKHYPKQNSELLYGKGNVTDGGDNVTTPTSEYGDENVEEKQQSEPTDFGKQNSEMLYGKGRIEDGDIDNVTTPTGRDDGRETKKGFEDINKQDSGLLYNKQKSKENVVEGHFVDTMGGTETDGNTVNIVNNINVNKTESRGDV